MPEILENTAGEIMTPEFVRLSAGTPAGEGLKIVRASGLDSEAMYTIYVTDSDERLAGVLELRALLFSDPATPVEALMDTNFHSVKVTDDQQHAAMLVRKYDLMSLPVVDEDGRLAGAIGVNSVVDIIEEEDTEDFEKMAALLPSEEGYKSSSTWRLAFHRIPWLIVLMLSSILSERLIQSYGALLISTGAIGLMVTRSMPMMMDTGGNCGSQSSTTIIRSMALGELGLREIWLVLWKELRTALVSGVGLGALYFLLLVVFFRESAGPALVVSFALLLTVVLSNVLGSVLPLVAHAAKLDPAVMAGPLITTVVDVCALFVLFSVTSAIL